MRCRFIALCFSLLCATTAVPTHAAVSVSIGINVPVYPQMAVVPGYPVYYAPGLGANFFFYDGVYWVLEGDSWYMSSWYNGPWVFVEPVYVPYYVLRVPVRYYMAPPPYFRGWQPGAPPRWGHHWGPQWEQRSRGWDHWDRHAVPRPAPLPTYQRSYSGDRYPSPDQQANLQTRNYRYQPRADVTRQLAQQQQQHQQQQGERRGPAAAQQQRPPQMDQAPTQRTPPMASQRQQERSMPQPQEPRQEGRPRREAEPRMQQPQQMPPPQQQQMPMADPRAPQHAQQGRAEPQQGRAEPQQQLQQQPQPPQQERGRGRGHGEEGKDKREERGQPGR